MVNAVLLDTTQLASHITNVACDSYPGLWQAKGHPLVEYVYHALRSCSQIGSIGMLVPPVYREAEVTRKADAVAIARRGYLVEQLLEMVERLGTSLPCIVFPTNAPLVQGEMFSNFLAAVPSAAVLAYAVHRKERVVERFPFHRKWPDQVFLEGEVVASRLLLFTCQVLEAHADLLSAMVGGRVAYLQLLSQLGTAFALKLKLGKMGLQEAARRISSVVGGHSAVIISGYAELAFTVDSEDDLRWVQRELTP